MKVQNGFVVRKIADQTVAVPVNAANGAFNGMIKLNATAADLFNFFLADHTQAEAVDFLVSKYDVDVALAESNVQSFLNNLLPYGIIK